MNAIPTGPLAPLYIRDFRYLLAGFAIGQMLMPLQFITQILWVQHYAPKDFWLILVAFIATSRGLGALTFGLYGGALADRFNRRKLLLAVQTLQIFCTAAIALLMYNSVGGVAGFSLFFLLTFTLASIGPGNIAACALVAGVHGEARGRRVPGLGRDRRACDEREHKAQCPHPMHRPA